MEDHGLRVGGVAKEEPDRAENNAHRETERGHRDRAIHGEDRVIYVSCAQNAEELLARADAYLEEQKRDDMPHDTVCCADQPHAETHPNDRENEALVTSMKDVCADREGDLHRDP